MTEKSRRQGYFPAKHMWPHLIWQPLLAMLFIYFVLMTMHLVAMTDIYWSIGAGALSSSSAIVFAKPSLTSSAPKRILGGYLIACCTGSLLSLILMEMHVNLSGHFLLSPLFYGYSIIAACSVAIALFIMGVTDLFHPPATGMSLVLVIDMRDYFLISIILGAAIVLCITRFLLHRYLIDLG